MTVPPHFAALYRWLVIQHHLGLPDRVTSVLDVGCDDGYIMRQLAAELRVGIDLAPRLRPAPEIHVLSASAEELPLVTGSFDCILAFDVLEHVQDDRSVMCEMLRVLAPHGTLWFSTPALGFRMIPGFLTPYTNKSFGHVRNGYTPDQIQSLLPDPENWTVENFFWNEPLWRLCFAPLHLLNLALPALAARLTTWCYAMDRRFVKGRRGHLFGTIRRRMIPSLCSL